jgi:hypothetical protein
MGDALETHPMRFIGVASAAQPFIMGHACFSRWAWHLVGVRMDAWAHATFNAEAIAASRYTMPVCCGFPIC